jgi:GMP synthase-like glutamine amidotransferase
LQYSLFNHFTNPYNVFHWHGDTFDLPSNAILVASTATCKHQAFLIGNNVLALQFHFEMNETVIENMLLHDGHELEEQGNFIQTKEIIRQHYHHLQQNKRDMFLLLDKFFG